MKVYDKLYIGGEYVSSTGSETIEVINASTGRNNSTENKLKQHILSGTFAAGFAMDLMAKDLATALDLAHAVKVPTPLAEECIALWNSASKDLPGADHTAIFKFLENLQAQP